MRRVNYARVIYNLMKQHAPQEIQRFNDLNKKLGRNLEEDLGFE
jgi:hypothetical protein